MSLSSPQLRRFVRRALVDATAAAAPDPRRLASAYNALSGRLRQRLQPLFGTTAVNALVARAGHVAVVEFPWLAEAIGKDGGNFSADGLTTVHGVEAGGLEE